MNKHDLDANTYAMDRMVGRLIVATCSVQVSAALSLATHGWLKTCFLVAFVASVVFGTVSAVRGIRLMREVSK